MSKYRMGDRTTRRDSGDASYDVLYYYWEAMCVDVGAVAANTPNLP